MSLVALLVDPAVGRYLCVNMTALALIQVDLHLDVLDLPCLLLKLCFELELKGLHFALLLVILVNKDSLIGVIQLFVLLLLSLSHLPNHVE